MIDSIHQFPELYQDIISKPIASLSIIANLILIESLLSVDNAAVLATMVMDLREEDRKRALKYGIWGAYIFRGIAMLFASFLIKIWWLKGLGGLYLLYLAIDWWRGKQTKDTEDDLVEKENKWFYKIAKNTIGSFWATVVSVEIMDMAFSIDNVFAAVAFSDNILLVCIGVFIGIFAMRFIAQWFVSLMEKYPFLEPAAFIVIGILGLKLVLSVFEHFYPNSPISQFLMSHIADTLISILTVLIFFVPILTNRIFGVPKNR